MIINTYNLDVDDDIITIEVDNVQIVDVHSIDCDDIGFDLLNETDLQHLNYDISLELKGKRSLLWSDNYLDEPSVIVYITIVNGKPIMHRTIESLTKVINSKVDIWKVELEYFN